MAALSLAFRYKTLVACFCLSAVGTGCKVYMPTLPYVPLVSERGQAEAGASVQALGQVAAYAAYSPVKHLLITASAAQNLGSSGDWSSKSTQGDVGLGCYRAFGAKGHWYVGALANYGLAHNFSRYSVPNLPAKEYQARYSRYQGQLCLARQGRTAALGVATRLTSLRFTTLTFNQAPMQEPVADLYGDWSLFARVGKGAFQGQFQVGGSTPLNAFFQSDSHPSSTATLMGLSVLIRPHLLGHRAASAQELE